MSRVLVIARACAAETDGPVIEAKLEHRQALRQDELAEVLADVRQSYEVMHGEAPARASVVTLPWADELDGATAYREAVVGDGVEMWAEPLREVG